MKLAKINNKKQRQRIGESHDRPCPQMICCIKKEDLKPDKYNTEAD